MARKSKNAKAGKQQSQQGSQRKVVVFVSLLAVMTVTCALLLALAPAPLAPVAASSERRENRGRFIISPGRKPRPSGRGGSPSSLVLDVALDDLERGSARRNSAIDFQ